MQPSAPEKSHITKVSKRAFCDVSELINLPPKPSNWPEMVGTSKRQTDFAKMAREQCLRRWRANLPTEVYNAIENIADSGWWIIHKNVNTDSIGWPNEWTKQLEGPSTAGGSDFACPGCGKSRGQDERDSCCNPECPEHKLSNKRDNMLAYYFADGAPEAKGEAIPPATLKRGVANFEAFARKVANSPELAYLTIMALFYRQTKDAYAISKFAESRQRVEGHLNAIDKILGSPGE